MIGRRRRGRDKSNEENPGRDSTPESTHRAKLDRCEERGDCEDLEEVDEQIDPYTEAAAALARTPNPAAGLAVVIGHLMSAGILEDDGLRMLGIDTEAAEILREAFDSNNNIDSLAEELETAAHLRGYRQVIEEIGDELGFDQSDGRRDLLKSSLAGFALENEIDDLRIAYRLMRLERPDLLP